MGFEMNIHARVANVSIALGHTSMGLSRSRPTSVTLPSGEVFAGSRTRGPGGLMHFELRSTSAAHRNLCFDMDTHHRVLDMRSSNLPYPVRRAIVERLGARTDPFHRPEINRFNVAGSRSHADRLAGLQPQLDEIKRRIGELSGKSNAPRSTSPASEPSAQFNALQGRIDSLSKIVSQVVAAINAQRTPAAAPVSTQPRADPEADSTADPTAPAGSTPPAPAGLDAQVAAMKQQIAQLQQALRQLFDSASGQSNAAATPTSLSRSPTPPFDGEPQQVTSPPQMLKPEDSAAPTQALQPTSEPTPQATQQPTQRQQPPPAP